MVDLAHIKREIYVHPPFFPPVLRGGDSFHNDCEERVLKSRKSTLRVTRARVARTRASRLLDFRITLHSDRFATPLRGVGLENFF